MDSRSAPRGFWQVARGGLARLGRLLAEADSDEEAVFLVKPMRPERTEDHSRRIAEARRAVSGGEDRRRRD